MEKLALTIALGSSGLTEAIKSKAITIRGVNASFVEVTPIIAAFREMVRHRTYDICEMAPTTYLIAKSRGARFTALPIILMRRFHHDGLVKHPLANIQSPRDLAGKRVGVRAYSVTTGVWTRGILQNDYGLDPTQVTWVVDDQEHVEDLKLPDNVEQLCEGQSLADLFETGRLAAAFSANAGIGRKGAPTGNWQRLPDQTPYEEVIPDHETAAKAWFGRYKVYPLHALLVVRDEILESHPWLPEALLDAFSEAKRQYLDRIAKGDLRDAHDRRYAKDMQTVGPDPLPFGMKNNHAAFSLLLRYAEQQGLIAPGARIEDLFHSL